jgi:hypothetical protein
MPNKERNPSLAHLWDCGWPATATGYSSFLFRCASVLLDSLKGLSTQRKPTSPSAPQVARRGGAASGTSLRPSRFQALLRYLSFPETE